MSEWRDTNLGRFVDGKVKQFKTLRMCVAFGGYKNHEGNREILKQSGLTFDFYQFIDKKEADKIENYYFIYFIPMTDMNHDKVLEVFRDLACNYYRIYYKRKCVTAPNKEI